MIHICEINNYDKVSEYKNKYCNGMCPKYFTENGIIRSKYSGKYIFHLWRYALFNGKLVNKVCILTRARSSVQNETKNSTFGRNQRSF